VDEPGDEAAGSIAEAVGATPARASCRLCGRPTYDPDKRQRAWARAVLGGSQVLVCPACQENRSDWADRLDRCEVCGETRLSVMLGEVVCRACGTVQGAVNRAEQEDVPPPMPELPATGA
jgi:hypothetical protein